MHTGLVGKSQHEYLKLADRHPNSKVNNVITPEEVLSFLLSWKNM